MDISIGPNLEQLDQTIWSQTAENRSELQSILLLQELFDLRLPRFVSHDTFAQQETSITQEVEWMGYSLSFQVFRGPHATEQQLAQLQALRTSYKIWGDFDEQLAHVTERASDTDMLNTHVVLRVRCPGTNNVHTYCVTAEQLILDNGRQYDELDLWKIKLGEEEISIRELLRQPAKDGTTFAHLTRLGSSTTLGKETSPQHLRFEKAVSIILTFYLALYYSRADYYISQNPASLRQVFSGEIDNATIGLSFPDFSKTFKVPNASTFLAIHEAGEDTAPKTIREYCFYWPGYWFTTSFFVQEIQSLVASGKITADDIDLVYHKAKLPPLDTTEKKLAALLEKNKFFKYFTYLFLAKGEIFEHIFTLAQEAPAQRLQPILCAYSQTHFLAEITQMAGVLEQRHTVPAREVITTSEGVPAASPFGAVMMSLAREIKQTDTSFEAPSHDDVARAYEVFIRFCAELLRVAPAWGIPVLTHVLAAADHDPASKEPLTAPALAKKLLEKGAYEIVFRQDRGRKKLHGFRSNNHDWVEMVSASRSLPDYSPGEMNKMKSELVVIILGGSTGSPIAEELAPFVHELHLADFDGVDGSNIRRMMAGVSETDIGQNKATTVQRKLLDRFSHANVVAHPESLSPDELESMVRKLQADNKTVYVVDAVDDVKLKLQLRVLARQLGIHLCMHTNLIGHSNIQIERPTEKRLFKKVSRKKFEGMLQRVEAIDKQIAALVRENGDPHALNAVIGRRRVEGVLLFLEVIGVENMPPSQMLNFLLFAYGRQMYLAQTPLGSHAGGALTAEMIRRHFLHYKVNLNYSRNDDKPIIGKQKGDRKKLLEVMRLHLDLFPEANAKNADPIAIIQNDCQRLLGVRWDWSYT